MAQPGPGAQHFARMARDAHRRARAQPGDDIGIIALDLGYELEPVPYMDDGLVVSLDETSIIYEWAPGSPLEESLRIAVGVALGELGSIGGASPEEQRAMMGDAVGYAGYLLGLNDDGLDPYERAPTWFVPMHQAYRTKVGTGAHDSGERVAVRYLPHLQRKCSGRANNSAGGSADDEVSLHRAKRLVSLGEAS